MRVNYLTSTLANLQTRVHRLESSVVFRFLRYLGPRLHWTGVPWLHGPLGAPPASPDAVSQEYADSARELVLFQKALSQIRMNQPGPGAEVRISIVIEGRELIQHSFDRLIRSINGQEHGNWEIFVAVDGETPDWLNDSLRVAGRRTEIVAEQDLRLSLRQALEQCTGEFVAILAGDAVLEPDALHEWVLGTPDQVVAAYSDWDHVDDAGQFHSPRFTPELSPELLRHALYWGRCYFVRTKILRSLNWLVSGSTNPMCDLPLRLSALRKPINRVPKVLWHVQSNTRPECAAMASPSPKRDYGRVSVIVCSRSPEQLTSFLRTLSPTLGPRHEVIVVAHGHGGQGSALEQVAADHNAKSVRYDGPFHFGLMNHLGVAQSSTPFICLLNDDVEPVTPDWLARMQSQAERPDVGVVGALLLYPDRTIQHAGVVVGGGILPTHLGGSLMESPYWPWLRMTRDVAAVTGACVVLRRDVWDELGGFDLRFPINYNDTDLCLRAMERGYRNLIEAEAVLIHAESQTRNPVVLPEESNLFKTLWSHLVLLPDRFFNPNLELNGTAVTLPRSPCLARHAKIAKPESTREPCALGEHT